MYTDSFSKKDTHGIYGCTLQVLAKICIQLLIVPVSGISGEGRYKGKNAGLYIFGRYVLFIIKLKYMLTTGDITT